MWICNHFLAPLFRGFPTINPINKAFCNCIVLDVVVDLHAYL
jgi:hypothetical protein